jgi:hypothetical protein
MAQNITKNEVNDKVKDKKVKKNNKDYKEYKVEKDTDSDGGASKDIYVVFDNDVSYKVKKIKIKDSGLDTSKYEWYGFFTVDDGYSDGIEYSVYFEGDVSEIAYYDGTGYGRKSTSDGNWNDTPMKVVTFDKGDPAIGITT